MVVYHRIEIFGQFIHYILRNNIGLTYKKRNVTRSSTTVPLIGLYEPSKHGFEQDFFFFLRNEEVIIFRLFSTINYYV